MRDGVRGRTDGRVELRLVQVLDDGLDVLDGAIGLEVASDEEFAGLFIDSMVLTSAFFSDAAPPGCPESSGDGRM